MGRPNGSCNNETARHREMTLARAYGSLRATVYAVRQQAQDTIDTVPPSFQPRFAWYLENLDQAFEAMNRQKPDFDEYKLSATERDLRTLAHELELELELDEK